jgi:hypothetical protein
MPGPTPVLPAYERVHNISLLPNKQLVRELKQWIALLKVGNRLPCSISSGAAIPLHEELPAPSVETISDHLSRSRNHTSLKNGRQRHDCSRWSAVVLLQQSYMKDIMDACLWVQLQVVSHSA